MRISKGEDGEIVSREGSLVSFHQRVESILSKLERQKRHETGPVIKDKHSAPEQTTKTSFL